MTQITRCRSERCASAGMLICLAAASIGIGQTLQAASVYWTGDTQVGVAGDGRHWSDPDNWISGGVDDLAPTDVAPGDSLNFGSGTIGTILLGQNRVASSLNFYSGFTLDTPGAPDVLTISTGGILVYEDQKPPTINAVIASNNGLTVQGSDQQSILVLSGANTYTGTTSLSNCTLDIQADSNLGNSSNAVALNNATLAVSSSATFNRSFTCAGSGGAISAGTGVSVTINGSMNAGGGGLALSGGGVLNLGGQSTLAALNNSAGTVVFEPGAGSAISIGTLSLAGGTIDLTNADMILHTAGTPSVQSLLASGFNKGKWNGVGIDSSAAASDLSHSQALGYLLNDDGTGQPLMTVFDGQTVVNTDTLVKYTYYGDTNLDGKVDGSDYTRIDSGFLTHATGWSNGDFNYDGVVNGSDYTLIDNAFNHQNAVSTAQEAESVNSRVAVVPEPSSVLILTSLACLGKRYRGHRSANTALSR